MAIVDFVFKNKPFAHQLDVFLASRDKEFYALLMEMGTGKTFVTLNTAAWLYAQGKIDALLVIAPNGVHNMWIDQAEEHLPEFINHRAAYYTSSPTKKEEESICKALSHSGLKIVSMNIESLATVKGVNFAKNFLTSFRSMLVIDESSTIKNPKAIRTKNLLKLSKLALYRRILTGTPVTQGPLDLYTQFSFLDSHILRCASYFSFRSRYAIMQEMRTAGRSFMVVRGYTNLDELQELINPHSYRVTKQDCLDLPEKLYVKRYVKLSESQQKLYNALKKEVLVEFHGKEMSAPLALTRLMRLQQIVGGFFTPDIEVTDCEENENFVRTKLPPEPIDKTNNRVETTIDILHEAQGKVIIWARFRAEIAAIAARIKEEFGEESLVEYHGGVDNSGRSDSIKAFQEKEAVRFFLGNVQAAGKGLTLHAATTVVYFSNNFSLEDRLQSEDRCHRIGQKHNVTYIDLIAAGTLDETLVQTLRDKKLVADLITGDQTLSWV